MHFIEKLPEKLKFCRSQSPPCLEFDFNELYNRIKFPLSEESLGNGVLLSLMTVFFMKTLMNLDELQLEDLDETLFSSAGKFQIGSPIEVWGTQ